MQWSLMIHGQQGYLFDERKYRKGSVVFNLWFQNHVLNHNQVIDDETKACFTHCYLAWDLQMIPPTANNIPHWSFQRHGNFGGTILDAHIWHGFFKWNLNKPSTGLVFTTSFPWWIMHCILQGWHFIQMKSVMPEGFYPTSRIPMTWSILSCQKWILMHGGEGKECWRICKTVPGHCSKLNVMVRAKWVLLEWH